MSSWSVQIVRSQGNRAFFAYLIMRGTPTNRSIWTCRRSNDLWQDAMKCRDERLEILWRMGWESTNATGNWNGSGTGPVARSHHRANRTRSGTVPLRSHREVVGSFRNDRTQWNRCEHGRPVAFRNGSGPKAVVWTRPKNVYPVYPHETPLHMSHNCLCDNPVGWWANIFCNSVEYKQRIVYDIWYKLKQITGTRQVTRAPCLSLSRHTIMNFQTGKRYKTIRHWLIVDFYTHHTNA